MLIVKCIKTLKGTKVGHIGDKIIVAVQKALPNRKIKVGEVSESSIVRVKKEFKRTPPF